MTEITELSNRPADKYYQPSLIRLKKLWLPLEKHTTDIQSEKFHQLETICERKSLEFKQKQDKKIENEAKLANLESHYCSLIKQLYPSRIENRAILIRVTADNSPVWL